jgi:hypothetical protein
MPFQGIRCVVAGSSKAVTLTGCGATRPAAHSLRVQERFPIHRAPNNRSERSRLRNSVSSFCRRSSKACNVFRADLFESARGTASRYRFRWKVRRARLAVRPTIASNRPCSNLGCPAVRTGDKTTQPPVVCSSLPPDEAKPTVCQLAITQRKESAA